MSLELLGIAELVRRESGIVIDSTHDARLRATIAEVLPGSGGAFERLSDPVAGPAHLLRLVDRLTTNETFFSRDRDQLDAIDWHALVRQAGEAGRGVVRVWSAGCATGEEPYTLALLTLEAFVPSTPPVAFLGTDVAERVLGLARAGRYVRVLSGPCRRVFGSGTFTSTAASFSWESACASSSRSGATTSSAIRRRPRGRRFSISSSAGTR